jgi:hypothetical protein
VNLHCFLPSLGNDISELKLKQYISAAKHLSKFEYRLAAGNLAFQQLCPLNSLQTPIIEAIITEAHLRDKSQKRTSVKDRDRSGGFQTASWPPKQRLLAYANNNRLGVNSTTWELIKANMQYSMLIGQFTGLPTIAIIHRVIYFT